MNLLAIKNHCWWSIDDAAHSEIDAATMLILINQALLDLAPALNIIKSATPTFTAGVADLPADFYAPVACYDGSEELQEIRRVQDRVDSTDETCQYYIPDTERINIYGIAPAGTVTLHYKAKPVALALDADIPVELPEQFHAQIAVYVKAMYALRMGRLAEYAAMLQLWEEIKKAITAAGYSDRYSDTDAIEVV
jgi:hypothetical protein